MSRTEIKTHLVKILENGWVIIFEEPTRLENLDSLDIEYHEDGSFRVYVTRKEKDNA